MTFGVRFVIAAWTVFVLFVGMHLDFGSANLAVGLGGCMLVVLVLTLLEPRFQHMVRIDSNRRIYLCGIPYYRIVLGASSGVILFAIFLWARGELGSFVHDLFRVGH